MFIDSNEAVQRIGTVLADTQRPLKERFRALFTLKNIGGSQSLLQINAAFQDESALLKHEAAYCLGQMGNAEANKLLIAVLEDLNQESIVRHEAAEALGAIGTQEIKEILQKFKQPEEKHQEVRETCELALERLRWLAEKQRDPTDVSNNRYGSIDPAPPLPDIKDTTSLRAILFDESASLFLRYRAMFSLRDLAADIYPEALSALCDALFIGSALFRHEIAFVLGQLQLEQAVDALIQCLEDLNEHEMVRHEAAEALGAIATHECYVILLKYLNDEKRVVRESCEIALDMCEYEMSPEFQYANTLTQMPADI